MKLNKIEIEFIVECNGVKIGETRFVKEIIAKDLVKQGIVKTKQDIEQSHIEFKLHDL